MQYIFIKNIEILNSPLDNVNELQFVMNHTKEEQMQEYRKGLRSLERG